MLWLASIRLAAVGARLFQQGSINSTFNPGQYSRKTLR